MIFLPQLNLFVNELDPVLYSINYLVVGVIHCHLLFVFGSFSPFVCLVIVFLIINSVP